MAAHRSLAAEIIAAGHAVYGHGWEHVNLEEAGAAAAVAAAKRVEALLAELRPTDSVLARFPYNAGYQRGWMHQAMREFHPDVRFASWSFSTRDWLLAEGCDDAQAVTTRCEAVARQLGSLPNLPGTIVLLHEEPFGASGHLFASVASILLPAILDQVAARGLSLDVILNRRRARGAWRRANRAQQPVKDIPHSRRVVCILCAGGLEHAGGIGRAMSYLIKQWSLDAPEMTVKVIDTRGAGHLAFAPLFLTLAMLRIIGLAMARRIALVHINIASRGSTARKCVLVLLCVLLRIKFVLHLHGAKFIFSTLSCQDR